MTLTEARSHSRLASAERTAGGITVLIRRSRQGYHLTRYVSDAQAQRWVYPNLYDLLVFARAQGFADGSARGHLS